MHIKISFLFLNSLIVLKLDKMSSLHNMRYLLNKINFNKDLNFTLDFLTKIDAKTLTNDVSAAIVLIKAIAISFQANKEIFEILESPKIFESIKGDLF